MVNVALADKPTKNRQTTCPPKVGVIADPRTKHRYKAVATKYVGFLPIVSDMGPANRAPVPTPNRNMAVERFSATWLTWNSSLAIEFPIDMAEPAQHCVKTRKQIMKTFFALPDRDQFNGFRGSSSPALWT